MIEPGTNLLHYRLIEKVGEGGMGVVWKARDTTLNRDVAIKLLPPSFAEDPDRRARFEREARLLATLNHPGIAGIYGLHEVATPGGKVHFIAMELVPGEDLAKRLERGPLSVEDAIDVARQVAEALEVAHEQGVIHRDLKPANIKRTPDGQIKVLDLGLAKALATESADPGSLSLSPTVTSAGTLAGTLLGTAAYMSPEQVKGKDADRRADIWAFGCVLQEMLTGKVTFAGDTVSETLAAVLRDEVKQDRLPEETPAAVRRLLERCLDRNRRTRLRDIGEARIALSPQGLAAAEALPDPAQAAAAPPRRRWLTPALAAVAALALAAVPIAFRLGSTSGRTPPPEVRATVSLPQDYRLAVNGNNAGGLSISPDGTKLTFSAASGNGPTSLFLRTLGSAEAQAIPGTEGATFPFWSPDSRELGFFADGKLKKLTLGGGAPMTIGAALEARGGTWAPDGTILFAPETQAAIQRVSSGGVMGDPVTTIDHKRGGESTHRFPSFLPDGRHFLYLRASHSAAPQDAVNSIWIGDTRSDETTELMQSATQATYANGYVFWVRDGFLMARAFSPKTLSFTGEPVLVGQGVVTVPGTWCGAFAASAAGPIAFQSGLSPDQELTIVDRTGKAVRSVGEPASYSFIRLSRDQRSLAVSLTDPASGKGNIWVIDLDRNVASRLTFDDSNEDWPIWSPDGKRIAYASRSSEIGIRVKQANGRGEPVLLLPSDGSIAPEDWSSDGKFITFDSNTFGKSDVGILPLDGGDPYSLISTGFDEGYARFSPDVKWLGYVSNESGRYELFLTRFPSGEGKWQLSRVGADWLIGWSTDGDELYYLDVEGKFCAVKVELGERVIASEPVCLFPTRSDRTWDSFASGEQFVIGVPADSGTSLSTTLILNWSPDR